ncbi:LysR substrate-binding domain-containing protein [Sphingobium sp. SJ10-10]|uniref:LysR substrate-binding domain-containing protein n=1 Tax=unclassified Sphingobium TaxID=2611147 RepID=UPI00076FE4D6|nr:MULTISPECIES: LysR substrate-binding domain-containing protein [unclassified Sphingobium]AMK24948.1 LysR family transcriptional regulator [Sphingobium sp. TKS]MEC6698719.1 LysR substrate-binding domain-containing protein [Sphingobium sp. SJ10-10]NML89790.1 LysR family transcriptional regulator [Sphingobium sp. TB-6]
MRRLPPLTALEAFVQVARLGSVKAAAEELALSTPALSRRVQALERFIGRPLFDRKHQALEINADGQRLLDDIAPTLDSLSQALENIQSGGNQLRLRLAVMPLFATQRLFPHLGALRQRHPQLHIDIETTPYAVARLGEGLDAAIVLAKDIDPALYAHELDHDEVYLIGRKAMLEAPNALTSPQELANHTVLLHRDMALAFEAWKEAVNLPDLQPLAIDNYDSGQLMLEAAAQGLGVAVMHASHYNEAQDPRLARLFPENRVESPYRYYFVCRPRALQTRAVRIFRDWLIGADI